MPPRVSIWPTPQDKPACRHIGGSLGVLVLSDDIHLYFAAAGEHADPSATYLNNLATAAHALANTIHRDQP